jgi:hypothetical protein
MKLSTGKNVARWHLPYSDTSHLEIDYIISAGGIAVPVKLNCFILVAELYNLQVFLKI